MYGFIRNTLNKTDPPKLLEERFLLENRALHYPPNHFLFDIFDRKLQQYIEGDFINYNTRYWTRANDPKKFEEFKEPFAVLTLGELEAGFVVCMVPLALSILVFAFEWIPNLWNLFIAICIFKKYFEVKQLEIVDLRAKKRLKSHANS